MAMGSLDNGAHDRPGNTLGNNKRMKIVFSNKIFGHNSGAVGSIDRNDHSG